MERPSKKTISLPVISVSEGQQLGSVKGLVVDPEKKEVIAFIIDQKGWFKENKIIPFNRVRSIGENAITVDKSGTAEKPANLPQILKLIKTPTSLINSKVVTVTGTNLGHIAEYWFHPTGQITKLELNGGLLEGLFKGKASLPAHEIITIGKDVIIVKEGAENRLESTERPLQNTVKEFKSVTTKAWETTVSTSQKLGQTIAHSIGKLTEEEEKLSKDEENMSREQQETPPSPAEEAHAMEENISGEEASEPTEVVSTKFSEDNKETTASKDKEL